MSNENGAKRAGEVRDGIDEGHLRDAPVLLGRAIDRVNAVQDRIVARYFDPYGVTLAYLAFAFVFLYYGLQKPLPGIVHLYEPLDVFATQLGLPVTATILFIGYYEIVLGVLFLFQRIRAAFWLFFAHQAVAMAMLAAAPYVHFQPPWLTVLGVDVPWAVSGVSAFVLKGVIFLGGFVVLASVELGAADGRGRRRADGRPGVIGRIDSGQRRLLEGLSGRPAVRHLAAAITRVNAVQDRIVARYFDPYGVTLAYLAFAFVFFYFGLQKPAPTPTPIREPVALMVIDYGIPVTLTVLFIGYFEMVMGMMFFFQQVRVAFWMFFLHQVTAFSLFFSQAGLYFQPPYLTVLGVDVPWALSGFSAFVLVNVVFVGAFVLLASVELGDRDDARATNV